MPLIKEQKIALSIQEAAEACGLSKWTLYKYTERGDLPVSKIGSRVLILVEDLKNWLEKNKRGSIK